MTDAYVYWEQQRSDQLCAMHAVNALLQAPIYTEIDLGQIGQALDGEELAMSGRKSNQNVSLEGYFSIQVIIRALSIQDITLEYLDQAKFLSGQVDPTEETALIFNLYSHWQTYRQVAGVWFDLNSLNALPGPQVVSSFALASNIEAMIGSGYTVFLAKGSFREHRKEEYRRESWQFWVPISAFTNSYPSSQYDEEAAIQQALAASRQFSPQAGASPELSQDQELEAAIALSLEGAGPPLPVLSPEPGLDCGAVELKVKFLDGVSHTRRFLPTDTVEKVALWVQHETKAEVKLMIGYPPRELELGKRLGDCGISASTNALLAARR